MKLLKSLLTRRVLSCLSFGLVFLIYTGITLFLYRHRLPSLFTSYGMPDIDTDGGLWYNWFLAYIERHDLIYDVIDLTAYPFGFDIAFSPVNNLVYSAQVFILNHIMGFSWQNLIFLTNVFSLAVYPLASFGAFLLCFYITKNKTASFMGGLLYGFSYYLVLMGRGQMSINHLEFIPYYILSLLYFLNKPTAFKLILSTFLFSILFKVDAYYAFFCGIFSVPIMFFYPLESPKAKLKIFVIYYMTLFFLLVIINLNFIISNLYLFNSALLVQSGRNSTPQMELLKLLYYFTLPETSWLYSVMGRFSYIMQVGPLLIATLGLVFAKKNHFRLIFFFCLLLSILLSSYSPIAFWLNQLYFRYFAMFRGVSRMVMCSSLFTGVLVALTIDDFSKSLYFTKIPKLVLYPGLLMVSFFFLSLGLNVDETWYRNTNMQLSAQLYEPIKNNPEIKVIAPYPMQLGGNTTGFPQTYQIISQILHEKKFASGVSPFSQATIDYYAKIKDIDKPGVIDELTKHNVDTLIIYNTHFQNQKDLNDRLQNDSRLNFLGRLTAPRDQGYYSAIDSSKDISVYQIKAVVEKNRQPQPLFYLNNPDQPIAYEKINAHTFVLKPTSLSSQDKIVFDSPYSSKWHLYPHNLKDKNGLWFLVQQPADFANHHTYQEYANVWTIETQDELPTTLTLYFYPHALNSVTAFISQATMISCLIFLGFYPVFKAMNRFKLKKTQPKTV